MLAHLWAALIRARGLKAGEEHFLDVSIDGRRRLQNPLPPSFIGSPILNVGIPTKVAGTTIPASGAKDIADKAAAIRNNVAMFDGEAVAALLHEMCFELSGVCDLFSRRNLFPGSEVTAVLSRTKFVCTVLLTWTEEIAKAVELLFGGSSHHCHELGWHWGRGGGV